MNVFLSLMHKESISFWRSRKWIWMPVVFMLLSVMQPLTLYFMEDILKMGGGLPEGTVFQMPVPTGGEVLASVLSQLNTIGVLLIIVSVMGAIAEERKSGSLTFLLVRPVSAIQIILAKTMAHSFLLVLSFAGGYLLSCYYTAILFEQPGWFSVLESMGYYSLYIVFVACIVIFIGSISERSGPIAIGSALFAGGLSLVSGWFSDALSWSPARLSHYASAAVTGTGDMEGAAACVAVTVLLIAILQFGSAYFVKKRSA